MPAADANGAPPPPTTSRVSVSDVSPTFLQELSPSRRLTRQRSTDAEQPVVQLRPSWAAHPTPTDKTLALTPLG